MKIRIMIYVVIIAASILFYFGRSIWKPYALKLHGYKTTEDIYQSIGQKIETAIKPKFITANAPYPPNHLTIIALKQERLLEIWTHNKNNTPVLIDTYKFTAFSGTIGPKLQSGDLQIPEGLYKIEYLNPNSSLHLSMKISYPNQFDKKMARFDNRTNLGGDIFIHGKFFTIGCIPIGDRNIEKLFILAYRVGIKNIDVIIAPYDMRIKKEPVQNSNIVWLHDKYMRIKNALQKYTIN